MNCKIDEFSYKKCLEIVRNRTTVICSLNLDPKRMLVIFDIISIREGDKNEEKTIHGVSDRLCFTAS